MRRPALPLAVLESIHEIEGRAGRLLEKFRPDFRQDKIAEIIRSCAVETFDKMAEYYASLRAPECARWLRQSARERENAAFELLGDGRFVRPERWLALVGEVGLTLKDRVEYWQGLIGGASNAKSMHTIGPESSPTAQPERHDGETTGEQIPRGPINRRVAVDAFIAKLAEAGRKITRTDIWTVAGYTDKTEFERFQRDDARATRSAAVAFNRVLRKSPEDFIMLLDKKTSAK